MATASSGGSSRPSGRMRKTKVSNEHDKRKPEADEKEKPDIEELRRRRAAYFSRPVAERQKVIRAKPATASSASARVRTATGGEIRRKKKSTSSHKASSSKSTNSANRSERRTAEYVYAPRLIEEVVEQELPSEQQHHGLGQDTGSNVERRRHSKRGSAHSQSLSSLPEAEVTPDDSVSVVAERRSSGSHSRSRPSLKRSNTTSSKLPPVAEHANDPPAIEAPRSSKRGSTLLGALFRRNTAATSVPPPPRLVECLTCGSDDIPHPNSAKLSCGHRMCHDCLKRIFDMSVKDPAHMPPRCCTDDHIPLKHVDKLFDLKFKTLWNRRYEEYNTENRIYCPAPKCGSWIKPSHIHQDIYGRGYAHCPRCRTKVCMLCNNKLHKSRDCPEDPEIAKLVQQAKEQGWQRCFNCNSMVELKEGCNHMTCRCLAEFCMICGSKWKTCECPWFNYTSLPNPDRLNDMRVPEPIRVMYRRVYNAAAPMQPPPPPLAEQEGQSARPPHERTYQQEMDERRRQERLDADLARRLQLASIMGGEDETRTERRAHMDTWGLGNAGGHFMNDNFVQNAADVVMGAFGDANMGRRGERASGRRRRARQSEQNGGDTGLAPNFLGDASVLGI